MPDDEEGKKNGVLLLPLLPVLRVTPKNRFDSSFCMSPLFLLPPVLDIVNDVHIGGVIMECL